MPGYWGVRSRAAGRRADGATDVDDDDGGERDPTYLPPNAGGDPTHADGHRPVFEGPDEQCDRDEKSTISKVALRIGD